MNEGQRQLVSTINFKGQDYPVVVACVMDDPKCYGLTLFRGDWQSASPDIVASVLLDNTGRNQTLYPDPKDFVNWATAILQAEWAKIEGNVPPPEPTTWTEWLERWLLSVAYFRNADGTHTIKIVEA